MFFCSDYERDLLARVRPKEKVYLAAADIEREMTPWTWAAAAEERRKWLY